MNHFVIMGVAGCGKSTVAASLAGQLNATFIEADDLHSPDNIAKMRRGDPLSDEDRWPWLTSVAECIGESDSPVFVSCSALRQVYRQHLSDNAGVVLGFIHLHAGRDVIAQRMSSREGHFMPLSLLDSQFALLEPLQANEPGVVIDISQTLDQVVADALHFASACLS